MDIITTHPAALRLVIGIIIIPPIIIFLITVSLPIPINFRPLTYPAGDLKFRAVAWWFSGPAPVEWMGTEDGYDVAFGANVLQGVSRYSKARRGGG